MKLEINAERVIEKVVKRHSDVGHIYLPEDWVGKRVLVIEEAKG